MKLRTQIIIIFVSIIILTTGAASFLYYMSAKESLLVQIYNIGNSIKYMDKDNGKIHIRAVQQENFIQFFVRDNGRGIDQHNLTKVFHLFNKTSRVQGIESTGVGLSIVKRIVESKGGRIWVESEMGKGSTFFFTLPEEMVSGNQKYPRKKTMDAE
jgi:light-regulated signal transduction histidine kinase (bacteriophytochrome)